VAQIAERSLVHFVTIQTLARFNSSLMLVLVGSGLAACAIGASIYDAGRLLSAW
jgi:hypothetical protein